MNKNETPGKYRGADKVCLRSFSPVEAKTSVSHPPVGVRRTKNLRHRVTVGLITLMNAEAHRI